VKERRKESKRERITMEVRKTKQRKEVQLSMLNSLQTSGNNKNTKA
jgi:hypothetical protein